MNEPDGLPVPRVPDQPVVGIGDIGVSQRSVFLPHGVFPLAGTTWAVTDCSRVEERISTTGVILAIVTVWFTCLLGLLFLLMKERRVTGYIAVTVQGPSLHYTTQIPAGSATTHAWVVQQVNWARAQAAVAR
ncbi:MAG: hypothetical protein QM621_08830 [Aeromicrobium sp.]|uniref:hypothetical protein n=1 Tax=Aeromicrobium sp. TaxID=1871063 RepID=UPI0039E58BF2